MSLFNIQLQNFRNFNDLLLEIPPEGIIIEGSNGSGKTNLLESIYFLCTGRSQRGSKKTDLINFQKDFFYIHASFLDNNSKNYSRSIGYGRDKNIIMKINDIKVDSIIDWFSSRPVVSFGPNDLSLVYGSPEERRKFLDILCSHIFEEYLKDLIDYRRALLNRNKLLQNFFDEAQISIYESQMAESGSKILLNRKSCVESLIPFFIENYGIISNNGERVNLQYQPSFKHDSSSKNECKNVFLRVLGEFRKKDKECGFTTVGPHRDDLSILFNDRVSKNFCSQGQCRSIVLSLKLASVNSIEKNHKEKMIFLIDDAVSELDTLRTSRVLPMLEMKGQIFLALPELDNNLLKDFRRLRIDKGAVVA